MINLPKVDTYWYLATPYTKYEDGLDAAYEAACKVTARLLHHGVPVFCPIAHSHPIALIGGIDPTDHEFWMAADGPMMKAAGGLLVVKMKGWQDSVGVWEEIGVFTKALKPLEFIDP